MTLTPVITLHLSAALAALAIGPVALWARRSAHPRAALHRAAGYTWVLLMLVVALSALFIRDFRLPNIAGYTPIHVMVPVVIGMLGLAFWHVRHGRVRAHRHTMVWLYVSACIVTGAFTLLPNRYLGQLVWGQWLGLL